MREATGIALVMAVLLGAVAISQFSSVVSSIQGTLSAGPLNDFVGLWPILVGLLALGAAVALLLGAVLRRF